MTKHLKQLRLIVLLTLLVASLQPSTAQTPVHVTPLMLQQWRLGQELGRYGLAQKDPHALLTAARLQRASRLQPSRAQVESDKSDVPQQLDAASLLARARTLAKDQPDLLALVDDAMVVRRTRGAIIGPQVQPIVMAARDTTPILLSYQPGQRAYFGVISDRLQDIGFSVQGPKNERVCDPAQAGGELFCEWVTSDTPDVRVVMTNRSASAVMLTFFHD